ncbi:DNA/RNA non-specific endonuclease [Bradyrhizobium sp. Ec3.3]|uniref:DNA/RNA non-specific endonuclease n=1 Tax=Bradyrhizobium sp. Ec3.3 TaxID=189753 RepID=UPI0004275CA9|nr:DNA/RNA non-specific endonuclease [Bradyrhizobium sp. Ec3.3]
MSKEERLRRLQNFTSWVHDSDPKLAEETRDFVFTEGKAPTPTGDALEDQIVNESIILKRTRPVLAIKNNQAELIFLDALDSGIWKERLTKAEGLIKSAAQAVGRIDLENAGLDWVGTGWLVHDEIVVTNRHVANEFVARKGQGFTFKMGLGAEIGASLDFLQEIGNPNTLVFRLTRVLHVVPPGGPDIAFFEVERESGSRTLAQPIRLAAAPALCDSVGLIGFPAYDSRIPDKVLMDQLFDNTYDKKRLAPGAVTRLEDLRLFHNCTSAGGNSGSALIDLISGEAVGLHFSGTFLATNYAVRSDVVRTVLDEVRSGRISAPAPASRGSSALPSAPRSRQRPSRRVLASEIVAEGDGREVSVTFPLTVKVSIGNAMGNRAPARFDLQDVEAGGEDDIEDVEEAVASDYRDRKGYDAHFLSEDGEKRVVELPEVVRNARDVLTFDGTDGKETLLKYEHFCVVMSRSRRMCFFSAVNIDGNKSRKSARVAWKWDPRIPREQQIMHECYGNPPKFSRGHMTRREDPGWGTPTEAKRGNEDSMHVTNTSPQMQAFNSPIWLALEDYALQHAREDKMRISVFTGPYLHTRDQPMYGVQIPTAFWKIIAFVHDRTGRLCATGYEMDQQAQLEDEAEEFVFGRFTSPQLKIATQVSIRSIEARSGLHFGRLASLDPLAGGEESLSGERVPLMTLGQIRFV